MAGDLMRDTGRSLDEILGLGFYEFNYLWFVLDELRARDLQHLSQALDNQRSKESERQKFYDWLRTRQPRRYRSAPRDAEEQKRLNEFMEKWTSGRRGQKG